MRSNDVLRRFTFKSRRHAKRLNAHARVMRCASIKMGSPVVGGPSRPNIKVAPHVDHALALFRCQARVRCKTLRSDQASATYRSGPCRYPKPRAFVRSRPPFIRIRRHATRQRIPTARLARQSPNASGAGRPRVVLLIACCLASSVRVNCVSLVHRSNALANRQSARDAMDSDRDGSRTRTQIAVSVTLNGSAAKVPRASFRGCQPPSQARVALDVLQEAAASRRRSCASLACVA